MTKQELLDMAKTYQNTIFSIAPNTKKVDELAKVRRLFYDMNTLYFSLRWVIQLRF